MNAARTRSAQASQPTGRGVKTQQQLFIIIILSLFLISDILVLLSKTSGNCCRYEFKVQDPEKLRSTREKKNLFKKIFLKWPFSDA